jgi:3-hydroxyethyl bacteriochlorophyllide a dehydrogenase
MDTVAVVLEEPQRLSLTRLALDAPGEADVVVDIDWSGVSTGTERLLWSGRMPAFPGMGYPLVPGYESVGRVVEARPASGRRVGEAVFVPGARCFGPVRGLFGGAARRLVVAGERVIPVDPALGDRAALIALAATARHAIAAGDGANPDLIVGHGVLGRLLARIAVAVGAEPVVWETNPARQGGAEGYRVTHPDADPRRDYRAIYDVSGDPTLLDGLIQRLAKGGEVVLAGFYEQPLSFVFPPAFMREARIRIAAEWKPADLAATRALIEEGFLSLDGLITHHAPATEADAAYRTAFGDPACLKMILDWRACA